MAAPPDPQAMLQRLQEMVHPWHEAVANPGAAQEAVLRRLLKGYARTQYGAERGADSVSSIEEYRRAFPVMTYEQYEPLVRRVMAGEDALLLYEPAVGWAITRGTTRQASKFVPMTADDLKLRVSAGRAVVNYVLQTKHFEVFRGVNLNLNFPSVVGKIRAGDRELEYGYSSGIYVKHVSQQTPVRSLPTQDEIDALGGGKTIADWNRRFELAYQRCKQEDVKLVGGVAPTAIAFARYVQEQHGRYPRDIWKAQIMTLGSVPGINTRYYPALRALYGPADVYEIYGATEGMFGQQRDQRRAWVPNYDLFFLEVETRGGVKMLYEMRPGETGSLVASTPIFPRYKIGDLIRAYEPPYFRCIGRDKPSTYVRFLWDRLITWDFDRL